jgi:hypothetical protein
MVMAIDPTIDNFKEGYATYAGFANYSYKAIDYLMEHNEMIWKLLKYNESDAWNESDLTHDEKAALIYNSQPDSTTFRVFMDSGNPDAWTKEICQLRIYPCKLFSQNRTQGIVLMEFDFFCHYKINQLSNYQTRVDRGVQELLGTLNGINLAGIGRLHFNGAESAEDKVLGVGQLPFKGKSIYMSNKEI